jgi:hypothetical protein
MLLVLQTFQQNDNFHWPLKVQLEAEILLTYVQLFSIWEFR